MSCSGRGLPEYELEGVQGWGGGLYDFPDYVAQAEVINHRLMVDTGFDPWNRTKKVFGPK